MNFIERISGLFKGSRENDEDIPILYTLPGCPKCKILKHHMKKHKIAFQEKNASEEGKEQFHQFHMENFHSIAHGPKGCISFPIYVNEGIILQGICNILAYLTSKNRLDGFFSIGFLHFEWIDGIHISGGNQEYADEFIAVLKFLREKGFQLQIDTNGKNSKLLKRVLDEGVADSIIMKVVGPRSRYNQMLGGEVDLAEIEESMALIPQFQEYKFQTIFLPHEHEEKDQEGVSYLTIQDVEETAQFIREATGSAKEPYFLKVHDDEPVDADTLEAYLSAARKHLAFTKIETESE